MTASAPPATPARSLLVIGGPGRSGTSLVTGLISRLGYHVPQPELGANASNPRGFGESIWPLNFNKRIMATAGVNLVEPRPDALERAGRAARAEPIRQELATWLAGEFDNADRLVIKDPRLVWFIELYRDAAEAAGARFGLLTMVRHPAETVRSADMAYRHLPNVTRTAGWLNGALTIERSSRGTARAFVNYEDLMADWRQALRVAERSLRTDIVGSATGEQIGSAADLVDPSLRRSHPDWAGLEVPDEWRTMATRTFDALIELTADESADRARRELDDMLERYRTGYQAALDVVSASIDAVREQERRRARRQVRRAERAAPTAAPHRLVTLAARLRSRLRRVLRTRPAGSGGRPDGP